MKSSIKEHKLALIISATIIIVALLAMYTIFNLNPSKTVSVSGQSEIDVVPDIVVLNFYLESISETASEAQEINSQSYDNFVSALKNIGVSESDVKTQSLSVQKNYEYFNGKRTENGYIAQHYIRLEMTSDKSNKLGQIIDAAVKSNALINYIGFELSDSLKEEKKAQATQKATEDARTKAESIATGLGKKLGSIISVSDSSSNYYPVPLYSREDSVVSAEVAGDSAQVAVANINPGEQTIYATINIIYKIK